MRGVVLALLLLPSPAAALTLEYELATVTEESCAVNSAGDLLCFEISRSLSSLHDSDGRLFARLRGHLTLEIEDGKGQISEFFAWSRGLAGISGGIAPSFTLDLMKPADASSGQMQVLGEVNGTEFKHALEFDPTEFLADLERLDFIAAFVPTLVIKGRCVVRERGIRLSQMHVAILSAADPVTDVSCDEARDDPRYRVFELPETQLTNLHVVAVPLPEPAAALLLGLGTGLIAGARRSRASME